MNHTRTAILTLLVCLAVSARCDGGDRKHERLIRDGSTLAKSIILTQRGEMAVKEEWAWIAKLYPDAQMFPMEHAMLVRSKRMFSYYFLTTPRGKVGIYFDTGVDDK